MLIQKVYAGVQTEIGNYADNFDDLGDLFGFAINLAIGVGWALVFVMLALGFVQYVMSRGEKTAVESAQKWLTYAVIGGVGLFFVSFVRRIIPELLDTQEIDVGENITDF